MLHQHLAFLLDNLLCSTKAIYGPVIPHAAKLNHHADLSGRHARKTNSELRSEFMHN